MQTTSVVRGWLFTVAAVAACGATSAEAPPASKSPLPAPPEISLVDGDRVVFLGDSITQDGRYVEAVEQFFLTRFPERKVSFVNAGWSADKATGNNFTGVGALARLGRDVLSCKPTVVVVFLGMNDGAYLDFEPAVLEVFEKGISAIVREVKSKAKARVWLMTPTLYDGSRKPSYSTTERYDGVLARFSASVRHIGRREGVKVVDLHAATLQAFRQAREVDPSYTFVPDGVHPDEDGHLLIAAEILRSWGVAARGTDLRRAAEVAADKSARFEVHAPLPWPVPEAGETMRLVRPDLSEMGSVVLRLTQMPPGIYALEVDGAECGEVTEEQLARGISIAGLSPVAVEKARGLAALLHQRAGIARFAWREIEAGELSELEGLAQVTQSLRKLVEQMTERGRAMARPHTYSVSLRFIGPPRRRVAPLPAAP